MTIKIIASHPLVRGTLSSVLSSHRDSDNNSSPLQTRNDGAFVIVIDTFGLCTPIFSLVRKLRETNAASRLIVLLHSHELTDRHVLDLLHAGVHGVLSLSAPSFRIELQDAVMSITQGNLYAAQHLKDCYLAEKRHRDNLLVGLTLRERQVLTLLVNKYSNKEIACELRISERTTKFHVANLFGKFHVQHRHMLLQLMADIGWHSGI
jgi:DNA-binding NarL/FixJ family response regulator